MKIQPYIAIDVETTGLDTEKDKVLQVGLVYDDGVSPVDLLYSNSFIVDPSDEPYEGHLRPKALHMNAWIFEAICNPEKAKYPIYSVSEARKVFHQDLRNFFYKVLNKDNHAEDWKKKKIQFAGKNVQGFDIPILKSNGFLDATNQRYFAHRVIDVGSLYYSNFGYVPSLGEINKIVRPGDSEVTHDALDDAYDVVHAIRLKMGVLD